MKKIITSFLIFLCLLFNSMNAYGSNIYKQGIYKLSDFSQIGGNVFNFQNVSSNSNVFILIANDKQAVLQSLLLEPNSQFYQTIPIKPEYKIVIVGRGELYFYSKVP